MMSNMELMKSSGVTMYSSKTQSTWQSVYVLIWKIQTPPPLQASKNNFGSL